MTNCSLWRGRSPYFSEEVLILQYFMEYSENHLYFFEVKIFQPLNRNALHFFFLQRIKTKLKRLVNI